jgi:hypothetical protein
MMPPAYDFVRSLIVEMGGKHTDLQQPRPLIHNIATGAIHNRIKPLPLLGQHALQLLIPVLLFIHHTALRTQFNRLINLRLIATRNIHITPLCHAKQQHHQRNTASDARDEDIPARDRVTGLDEKCAPRSQSCKR